jgi:ABC-2 type transport system permease protein
VSALAAASRAPDSNRGRAPGAGVWAVCRTEQEKLTAQVAVRVLTLLCLVGPFAFGAVLGLQSGTPSDALFGAWVHASGFALSLVVLGFAGSWGLPLLAGILAGDLFS